MVLGGCDAMPYSLGSEQAKRLPDAFGAGCFSGVHSDPPSHVPRLLEMLDKEIARVPGLVAGQVKGDQVVALGQQGVQLTPAYVWAIGPTYNANEFDLDPELVGASSGSLHDRRDDAGGIQLVGLSHEPGAEPEFDVVNAFAVSILYVFVSDTPAGVQVNEDLCHPLEFLDKGHDPWSFAAAIWRAGDLHMGPQPINVPGWKRQIVLPAQIQNGFQTYGSVQMAMEINEGQIWIYHAVH
jgi:hypothetical protein